MYGGPSAFMQRHRVLAAGEDRRGRPRAASLRAAALSCRGLVTERDVHTRRRRPAELALRLWRVRGEIDEVPLRRARGGFLTLGGRVIALGCFSRSLVNRRHSLAHDRGGRRGGGHWRAGRGCAIRRPDGDAGRHKKMRSRETAVLAGGGDGRRLRGGGGRGLRGGHRKTNAPCVARIDAEASDCNDQGDQHWELVLHVASH